VTTNAPLVIGNWHHIAVVGSSATDTATLYLNGVQVAQTPFTDGLFDPTANTAWTVGRGQFNGNPADFVDGQIDEVRWTAAALTPAQFLNIPEPASAGLLALGAIGLLARRSCRRR
jgi:hypothetical protein